MKKRLLILGVLFIVSIVTYGQISLEHTFNTSVSYSGQLINMGNTDYYISTNPSTNQIFFYNTDYSLYKTVNVTPPTGYEMSAAVNYAYKDVFTTDGEIIFVLTCISPDAFANQEYNSYSYTQLINEDGVIIKELGYSYLVSTGIIMLQNNDIKLSVLKWIYNEVTPSVFSYSTEIYSLPGAVSSDILENKSKNKMLAYPNPTNFMVTLSYNLDAGESSTIEIFDINGHLIESKQIGSDFNKIQLNVSRYPKGTYVYKVKDNVNKFIVH